MSEDAEDLEVRYAELLSHYQEYLGDFNRIFKYDFINSEPFHVVEYKPPNDEYDWIYVTMGASQLPMPFPDSWKGPRPELRVELELLSNESNEHCADLLASLALYPFQNQTFLAAGHTLPGPKNVYKEYGLAMTDMFLTRPYFSPEGFEVIHHQNNTHTEILWVIPIYTSERVFVAQNGYKALEGLFSDNNTDTSDFRRLPVVQ